MGSTVDGTNPYNSAADRTDQTASDGADNGHAAAQQNVFDALRGDPDKANTAATPRQSSETPNGGAAGSAPGAKKSEPLPVPVNPRIYTTAQQAPPGATSHPGSSRLADAGSNRGATVAAGPQGASKAASAQTSNAAPAGNKHYDAAQQSAYHDTYTSVYKDSYNSAYQQVFNANYDRYRAAHVNPDKAADLATQDADEWKPQLQAAAHNEAGAAATATADQVGLREQLQAQIANTKDPAKLAQLKQSYKTLTNALIAKDVYNGKSIPSSLPPGVRRVEDPAELAKLGLKESDLKGNFSGYFAAVYHDSNTNTYIVANRGTEKEGNDWANDIAQDVGIYAPQYHQAVNVADKIAAAHKQGSFSGNIEFTGHSLGGGLAATQSLHTGLPAQTFNAAGLSPTTIALYARHEPGQITAVSNGDIVSNVDADNLGHGKPLTPVSLPVTQEDGKIALGRPDQAPGKITLHGMDYVISSIFYDAAHGGSKARGSD